MIFSGKPAPTLGSSPRACFSGPCSGFHAPNLSGRVFRAFAGFGMRERGRDLLLVEPRAVIALDQQSDAAAGIDVPRPAERLVERAEFLEQIAILLQRRDRLRA